MKPQVHELPFQVHEGPGTVHGQLGGKCDDSRDHQRGHSAGRPRHGQDQAREYGRQHHRHDDTPQRLEPRRAQGVRRFAESGGHAGQSFLHGHDDHGQGEQDQGQRAPEDAAAAESRFRKICRKEQAVQGSSQKIHEESESENPEYDGGHPGQAVHGDTHHVQERTRVSVLSQIKGRQHAEGHDDDRHEDDHRRRAENRRVNSSQPVIVPRWSPQVGPGAIHIVTGPRPRGHRIGCVDPLDVREGNGVLPAIRQ